MRIAVDAFGGDNAPAAVVEGCIDALKKYPDMSVTLCGDEERIKAELEKYRYDVARVDILHAPEIISCDEQPDLCHTQKEGLLPRKSHGAWCATRRLTAWYRQAAPARCLRDPRS